MSSAENSSVSCPLFSQHLQEREHKRAPKNMREWTVLFENLGNEVFVNDLHENRYHSRFFLESFGTFLWPHGQ